MDSLSGMKYGKENKNMFNIRRCTFETNSSSTHSICITKQNDSLDIPDKLIVNVKNYEFGWEYDEYSTTDEKLAYLVLGIIAGWNDCFLEQSVKLNKLVKTIGKWVKTVHIEGLDIVCYNNESYFDGYDGYVDHASELEELVDALLNDENMLKRYLFSKDSFISTGNDNSDFGSEINVDYEYDEFYKGN